MANPIPIRPWSCLASLRSPPAPESHPKPQPAQPSLKTTNTSSHDNNATATKSLPTTPHVHNPMLSQKLKLTTPTTFPPSKLVVHPQPVEEVTIEKPNGIGQSEKQVTNKENETKGEGTHTKLSGSEGRGVRVITISGENRGAEMQITQSRKKPVHKSEKVRALSSAMYGNSNVQCVNNSMLFNASLTHHDPGMHLTIPKKPIGEGFHLKERVGGQGK